MTGKPKGLGRRIAALILSWIFYLPTLSSTFWLPMWIALSIIFPTIFNYFPESPAPLRLDWIPPWIFRILYIPWIPMTLIPGSDWITEFLYLPEIWTNTPLSFTIELVRPWITLGGFLFFLASLTQLLWFKRRGAKLVTTGFYGLVRHPQYLGIFVWTFGHILYALPLHLRPADLIAWTTLVFLYIALARYEEKNLEKEFEEEYRRYREQVPFIIPLPRKLSEKISAKITLLTPKNGKNRRLTFIAAYITIILLIIILSHGRTYCYWEKALPQKP